MKDNFKKIILLLFIPIITGAGYMGDLPDLKKNIQKDIPKNDMLEDVDVKDILPLDENKLPPNYNRTVAKDENYTEYLKDLDQIILLVERVRTILKDQADVQQFAAVSNILNLYVNNFEKKYVKRTEKYFETYKSVITLNQNIQTFLKYWLYSSRNVKYISNYKTAGFYSQESANEKSNKLLNIIEDNLVILKN